MKKDIYIIRNDINDKVYIGQSNNVKKRFLTHCALTEKSIYFDKIIHKYGKEHFWYEILESNIENFNEREQYWIKYYNSIVPNGYNISIGGDQKSQISSGINVRNSSIKDEQLLFNIINDLQNTDLTIIEIGEKYKISKGTISKINTGRSYKLENYCYPLRPFNKSTKSLAPQQEQEIKSLIKNSILTFTEIANQYKVLPGLITKINIGDCYFDSTESYPLRSSHITDKHLSEAVLNNIYDSLKNGRESLRAIGRRLGVHQCTIQGINNGTIKCYFKQDLDYPIRRFNPKKPVSTISAKESTTTIDT